WRSSGDSRQRRQIGDGSRGSIVAKFACCRRPKTLSLFQFPSATGTLSERGDVSLAHSAVDILIIGSGASGAAAAWRLSDAGFRIMCLEQGKWQKPEEYAPGFADW